LTLPGPGSVEGWIDEFSIIEQGREVLTKEAERAKKRFRRVRECVSQ
jgi:hypothetical protein